MLRLWDTVTLRYSDSEIVRQLRYQGYTSIETLTQTLKFCNLDFWTIVESLLQCGRFGSLSVGNGSLSPLFTKQLTKCHTVKCENQLSRPLPSKPKRTPDRIGHLIAQQIFLSKQMFRQEKSHLILIFLTRSNRYTSGPFIWHLQLQNCSEIVRHS